MSEQSAATSSEIGMDPNNLFREEMYTDRRIGTIHVLIPVLPNGADDPSRDRVYLGETQMRTAAGPLPISFEIEAGSIGEAAEKFGDAAREGAERTIKQIEEMQREAANKIVVPGSPEMDAMTGGLPGGGKIQLP